MLDISCFIVFFVFGEGNAYLEQRPVTLANTNQNSLYFSKRMLPLTKTEITAQSLLKHAKIMKVTVVWGWGGAPQGPQLHGSYRTNSCETWEKRQECHLPKPLWEFLAARLWRHGSALWWFSGSRLKFGYTNLGSWMIYVLLISSIYISHREGANQNKEKSRSSVAVLEDP